MITAAKGWDMDQSEAGLGTYLREIGRISRLTPAQERDLGERIAGGDEEALRQMVEANLRLVIPIAKQYQHTGVSLEDLIQEGNIGLLHAAQKFDYLKGFRFSTYATWWIRQSVSRAVANYASAIRVPVHVQEAMARANRAIGGGSEAAPPDPEASAILEALDSAQKLRHTVSLDQAFDDTEITLTEFIADDTSPSPHDVATNTFLRGRLQELLVALPDRERRILSMRYGLVDGQRYSLAEVGASLHITRERVRQIETMALARLRQGPGGRDLAAYL